jgi:hypothetical protein
LVAAALGVAVPLLEAPSLPLADGEAVPVGVPLPVTLAVGVGVCI